MAKLAASLHQHQATVNAIETISRAVAATRLAPLMRREQGNNYAKSLGRLRGGDNLNRAPRQARLRITANIDVDESLSRIIFLPKIHHVNGGNAARVDGDARATCAAAAAARATASSPKGGKRRRRRG